MKSRQAVMTIEQSMLNREEAQPGRFADRSEAGRQLAARLLPLAGENPLVLGLPRGGVPVAEEVATLLEAPLEILAVRKLGAPHNPEYGIGAIAEDRTKVLDQRRWRCSGSTTAPCATSLSARAPSWSAGSRPTEATGRGLPYWTAS
jgi:putative phosphoribosyl transferase